MLIRRKWDYWWKHLPTGESDHYRTEDELTREEFLERLCGWNAQAGRGTGLYIYWPRDPS